MSISRIRHILSSTFRTGSWGFVATTATLLVTGCGTGYELIQSETSPDGKLIATVEYSDPGACCSDWSKVSIISSGEEEHLSDPGEFVRVSRSMATVQWYDDQTLVVEACGARSLEARTRISELRPEKQRSRSIVLAVGPTLAPGGEIICQDE